ncbi:MAG TPA: PLP-dependent aminotransferase family protein [Actinomycetota bacterium]|nr:PLP-dependent aminotransferase family protein [Actinomycetota bacterium]
MAELDIDPLDPLYARRAQGLQASEIRALFAVAARPDVISLAGGMPYVQALPEEDVLSVVRHVLQGRTGAALQYGGGPGQPGLRRRLAALMAEQGVEAEAEAIVVTNGAQQALDLIGKVLIDPGDEIVVEAPAYVGALSAFSAYEPRFLTVPLDDEGMVVDELRELLVRGARPKLVYTVPDFHNPAGVTMSLRRRQALVALCREAGVPIVEDDPYAMLRFEGPALPRLRALDPEGVIYLGTLSKIFSPGIRIGWALAPPGLRQRLVLAKEAADLCSSNFMQLVAEGWLADGRWREHLASLVAIYRGRRDAMLEALEAHLAPLATWTRPGGGFYVWVTVPPHLDVSALLAAAVERGVAYVPGTAFYPDGRGRDRMRLAFSYPPEERIREGVRRLGELLGDGDLLHRDRSLPG